MEERNLSTLFDEASLSEVDRAYLHKIETQIKGILVQSAMSIGGMLIEVRKWFADKHRRGFETWAQTRFGYTPQHLHRFMDIAENLPEAIHVLLPDLSHRAQHQLAKSPDPLSAVEEAVLRKQIEGEITEKKAREIADYQRAEQIAKDEARSTKERAEALDKQLTYVNNQLKSVQQKLQETQTPKVVEKKVEVVPQYLKDQINQLQERQKQIIKERDSYRKQLDEDRATGYARRAEEQEGERIRVMFAEATRDEIRSIRVCLSKLPSVADADAFDADDWQRLGELKEAVKLLAKELDKFTNRPIEQSPLFIVDAGNVVSSGSGWSHD
jgi:hypothetical protein